MSNHLTKKRDRSMTDVSDQPKQSRVDFQAAHQITDEKQTAEVNVKENVTLPEQMPSKYEGYEPTLRRESEEEIQDFQNEISQYKSYPESVASLIVRDTGEDVLPSQCEGQTVTLTHATTLQTPDQTELSDTEESPSQEQKDVSSLEHSLIPDEISREYGLTAVRMKSDYEAKQHDMKQRSSSISDVSDQQNQTRVGVQANPEITDELIKLEMKEFRASEENESKKVHLYNVCTLLKNSEKDVVNVWPGYKEQQPQEPVFVMMTKGTKSDQLYTSSEIGIYRRRYDLVSDEASAILNSEMVQKNRFNDIDKIRKVIDEEGANLFDKHSNITVINGCSYKSSTFKVGALKLEPTPCVVIHCLVKGIIPFGEDLFPGTIDDIPTDVREGLFYLGVCADREEHHMEGVEEDSGRPDIPVTPGPRGTDFNPKLLMGSGVGLLDCPGRGSIGGFVSSPNGDLSFITCAHVFAFPSFDFDFKTITNFDVTQPADDDLPETQRSSKTICGTVDFCVFSGNDGVDAALVKISPDRRPIVADFIWASSNDLKYAGFDVPPNFNNGTILTKREVNARRNEKVVKFGSSTGVTEGSIHFNDSMVRFSDMDAFLWNDKPSQIFTGQIEISQKSGQSSTFFNFGDSGALVFMLSEGGSQLQCIGMAIGYTNTNTCVVTPIEDVFRGLGFPAGQQFQRF